MLMPTVNIGNRNVVADRREDRPTAIAPEAAREQLVQNARSLRDLLKPNPLIYWTDFLGSWLIGTAAMIVAVAAVPFSWAMIAGFPVAVYAWYRVSVFIHEITHIKQGSLPGFRAAWNALVGIPMLLPSIMYEGVHPSHHRPTVYGTKQDPEYHPINGRPFWIIATELGSLLIPWMLALRFLVLAPIGLLIPWYHRRLEREASAYVINPLYRRTMNAEEKKRLLRAEVAILLVWGAAFTLAYLDLLPWRAFLIWGAVYSTITFVNHTRMLAAHRFHSEWQPTDRVGQFFDSIDNPHGLWMELLAPLGMRYHALHHLVPTLPYHNLGRAYRRLTRELPPDAIYRSVTSPSVVHSWIALWRGYGKSVEKTRKLSHAAKVSAPD